MNVYWDSSGGIGIEVVSGRRKDRSAVCFHMRRRTAFVVTGDRRECPHDDKPIKR